MALSFSAWERIDSHTFSREAHSASGDLLAEITKNHGNAEGALSLTDTPGRVESYELTAWPEGSEEVEVLFEVSDHKSARAALAAAKARAEALLGGEA